ncbi:hypothetical protein CHUAL_005266 [Chamberlinius hualienensis]
MERTVVSRPSDQVCYKCLPNSEVYRRNYGEVKGKERKQEFIVDCGSDVTINRFKCKDLYAKRSDMKSENNEENEYFNQMQTNRLGSWGSVRGCSGTGERNDEQEVKGVGGIEEEDREQPKKQPYDLKKKQPPRHPTSASYTFPIVSAHSPPPAALTRMACCTQSRPGGAVWCCQEPWIGVATVAFF